jgi:hypothetical protein
MTAATSPLRRWAHLSLLVAALLQFAGAAAGPWAHELGRGHTSGHTLCAPDRHGPHDPVSHDELACWAWQAFSSVAPPPADAPLPAFAAGTVSVAAAPERGLPSVAVARPRARAPPAS